jgi:hypothetical protein
MPAMVAVLVAHVIALAFAEGALAQPITDPHFEPRIGIDVPPTHGGMFHEPGVLFINFDGAEMQNCNGSDWPVMNCSTIMNDVVLPYSGGESTRAAVVQLMQGDVADFALTVVDARPPDDTDYDMVMVGNWDPAPDGGFAGVAPTIDCWNTNRAETAFSLDIGGATTVAKIIGQEAAHVWGLEHVDADTDLLFPTVGVIDDPEFEDACHQIVVIDGGIVPTEAICPEMHAANCDEPDTQNSYLDLLMVFGAPAPDVTAPTITITAPAEGEVFPPGTTFDLVLSIVDDVPPQLFEIYASLDADEQGGMVGNTALFGPDFVFPFESALPDGEHFVRVDAFDQDGNGSTAIVHFSVGDAPATTGEPADSAGDDDDDADDDDGTTAADDDGTDDGSDDDDDTDGGDPSATESDGCGCASGRAAASSFVLLFLGLARRRRAHQLG